MRVVDVRAESEVQAVGAPRPRLFQAVGDDRYRFELPEIASSIEVDRLRREKHELQGELCIRCSLPGARTFDG
ncbi:MAG TPA: hypothetical protein VEX68_04770, partial [Bryobacteraceae bacterium]|nr:hypothetical protein [Bryobacteraceae bacterium]